MVDSFSNPNGIYYKDYLSNLTAGSSNSLTTGAESESSGKMISGLLQAFQGISMLQNSASIAKDAANFQAGAYRASGLASKQGADFQAKVYRQAGEAAKASANYNIALEQLQLGRTQEATGQELLSTLSSNWAKAGSSGVSVYSRSTIAVQNSVISAAERNWVRNKNDTLQRQQLIRYQGNLVATQYENEARAAEYSGLVMQQEAENRARAAEYQGEVESYKAKSAMAQQIGGAIGSIFGGF